MIVPVSRQARPASSAITPQNGETSHSSSRYSSGTIASASRTGANTSQFSNTLRSHSTIADQVSDEPKPPSGIRKLV